MIDKKIISRIRKLLALATSPNRHEAASAFEAARKLMSEHGLDADDLQLGDIEEHVADGGGGRKPPLYLAGLIIMVQAAFGVASTRDVLRQQVIFYGQAARAELAAYSFVVLSRELAKARRLFLNGQSKRARRSNRIARADAFCEGWVSAAYDLVQPLVPSAEEKNLLVTYALRRWPNLGHCDVRHARTARDTGHAFYVGHLAGRNVRLDRPFEANAAVPRLAG